MFFLIESRALAAWLGPQGARGAAVGTTWQAVTG